MTKGTPSTILVESEVDGFESVDFKTVPATDASHQRDQEMGETPPQPQTEAGNSEDVPGPSEIPCPNPSPSPPTGTLSPEEQALKDIAATAEKVAGAAKNAVKGAEEAAKSLSQKLNSVVESNDTFSRIAGGISSWWATLDPVSEPAESHTDTSTKTRAAEQVSELYGLSESDTLLEQFPCKLWQPYTCSANECTPPIQVEYPVMLNITELNFCFCAMDKNQKYKSVVPHARLKTADKVTTKDGVDTLEVTLNDGPKMVFKDFDSDTALESALALLEHLATSDR